MADLRVRIAEMNRERMEALKEGFFYWDHESAQKNGDAIVEAVFPDVELEAILEEE
jgi:hypothetical protein